MGVVCSPFWALVYPSCSVISKQIKQAVSGDAAGSSHDTEAIIKGILWYRQLKPALYRDFTTYMPISLHKRITTQVTKQSSKFQTYIRALITSQSALKNKMMNSSYYFLTFILLFVSHFAQALYCFDTWCFGNRFVIGTIFILNNKLSICLDEKITWRVFYSMRNQSTLKRNQTTAYYSMRNQTTEYFIQWKIRDKIIV